MGLYKYFQKSYDKKVSAKGISLFRIFYAALLLEGAIHNMYYMRLLSDPIPFQEIGIIDLRYAYIVWIFILLFLLVGYKTRYMAIANWVLMVGLLSSLTTFQYHFDYANLTAGIFLIFIPSNQVYSIDSLIAKIKNPLKERERPVVRKLYILLMLFFTLGIVYIASMPNKLSSWMYLNGLCVWLPSSIPQNAYLDLTPILNMEWFVKLLGYTVLLYEISFPFLFFRKRWRVPLLIVGIGLHLGIAICFPIPEFGIVCLMVLILLVPLRYFDFKLSFNWLKRFRITIFYDGGCKLCNNTRLTFKHFDFFRLLDFQPIQEMSEEHPIYKSVGRDKLLRSMYSVNASGTMKDGISTYIRIFARIWFLFPVAIITALPPFKQIGKKVYAYVAKNRYLVCNEESCELRSSTMVETLVENPKIELQIVKNGKVLLLYSVSIFLVLIQVFYTIKDDYSVQIGMAKIGYEDKILDLRANHSADSFGRYWTKITGMSAHGVFLYERHFKEYDHQVAITYVNPHTGEEDWVPLYKKNGMVDYYNFDRFWLKWNFRSNGRHIDQEKLKTGIKLFSAFYAGERGISLENARFNIKVRTYDPITGWERDYLKKQLKKPWRDGGYVEFRGGEYHSENLKDIESIEIK